MVWQYTASIINRHSTLSMMLPHFKSASTISVIIKLMFSVSLSFFETSWVRHLAELLQPTDPDHSFSPWSYSSGFCAPSCPSWLTWRERTKLLLLQTEDRKWKLNTLCWNWRVFVCLSEWLKEANWNMARTKIQSLEEN